MFMLVVRAVLRMRGAIVAGGVIHGVTRRTVRQGAIAYRDGSERAQRQQRQHE